MADLTVKIKSDSKEIDKATKKIGTNLEKAGKKGEKSFKKLDKKGTSIFSKLGKKGSVSFGKVGNAVEGITDKLGDAGGAAGGFTSSLMSVAAAAGPVGIGIATIATALIGYGMAMVKADVANRKFLSTFGEFDKRGQIISDALVTQLGENETAILKAGNAFRKAFDLDIGDSFAIMKQAADKGANSTGELLDNLSEYSPILKKAGYDAEQSAFFITKFANAGVHNDFGVDAIKEFGINIRAMSPITAKALKSIGIDYKKLSAEIEDGTITQDEAMRKVSARLLEFPDTSRIAQNAISGIFSNKGEDLGRGFLEIVAESDRLLAGIPDRITAIQRAQEGMNAQWKLFKLNIFDTDSVLGKMAVSIYDTFTDTLRNINIFFEVDFLTKMKALWNGFVSSISKVFLIPKKFTKFLKFDLTVDDDWTKAAKKVDEYTNLVDRLNKKNKTTTTTTTTTTNPTFINPVSDINTVTGKTRATSISGGGTKSITLNIDNIIGELAITQSQDPLEVKKLVVRALQTALADTSKFA